MLMFATPQSMLNVAPVPVPPVTEIGADGRTEYSPTAVDVTLVMTPEETAKIVPTMKEDNGKPN